MNLLRSRRVDPIHQSPRTKMYGYFTHGTDPPPRPYSSGFFFLPDLLRPLPSPTHSVADFSVTSFRLLQVPRSSPTTGRAPFPTSLSLIGSLPPEPPEILPVLLRSHAILPYRAARNHHVSGG